MDALRHVDSWPVSHVSVGVAAASGPVAVRGDESRGYPLASVTKPVTALACLVAAEEGMLTLDDPAGPPGATFRHLLAHASGLPLRGCRPIARPGRRRIYSDRGFDVLGDALAERARIPFSEYLSGAVLRPLGLGVRYEGRPGSGLHGRLTDLLAVGWELLRLTVVSARMLTEVTTVAFPGLSGVLPGFGRMDPNDWGLGFELRDGKRPH